MRRLIFFFVSLLPCFTTSAIATTPEPHWIRLYDVGMRAPEGKDIWDVPNVLEYIPDKTASPTTAIIICPGGGYQSLQMQEEGENAADWFKAHGIAAFVLPYRVHQPNGPPINPSPMHDAQRAERWVRSKAAQFNLDPNKIGIMGFSAGGMWLRRWRPTSTRVIPTRPIRSNASPAGLISPSWFIPSSA